MAAFHLVAWFAGGAFATNAVPHLVAGVQGRASQSPFAKPPGVGLSSSRTNVLWAFANLAAAWLLLTRVGDFDPRAATHVLAAAAGAFAMALGLASHFGKLHGGQAVADQAGGGAPGRQ